MHLHTFRDFTCSLRSKTMFPILIFSQAFSLTELNKFLLIRRKQLTLFLKFSPLLPFSTAFCLNIIHWKSFLEGGTSCTLVACRLDRDNKWAFSHKIYWKLAFNLLKIPWQLWTHIHMQQQHGAGQDRPIQTGEASWAPHSPYSPTRLIRL